MPLVALAVVTALVAKAIGGWVAGIGPMVIVLGAGMLWGNVVRARRQREEEEGDVER
ncbi:hypothetical protein ACFY7N_04025 [Streptomyces albidoflavus]|uniref:hypothetical protein n=1 Tax=Streptomyces TaxID=1883 RepID=UPI0001AEDF2F|nr:hypothetical protein [Streptomyces albidoflavus]MYX48564.1 hypothetical protein [Streptomyces sp. SID8385]BDH53030.1 hypothetical protein MTP02_40410 [Streptomyces albus]AGI90264.1 Hypothetical protein XNR_3929 [Streptomyces albidoflavus]AMM10613.1 hypothetical protein Salbus254_4150 [Streptomyces albidoflavus]QLP94117.1 Hypothetical protein XNRR2_3929 [Streptomyces albidoflavus]